MNPMNAEMLEGSGDLNGLLVLIGWAIYLMIAYGIAKALALSHKNSLRLWAVFNIAPIVLLLWVGHFQFLVFLGLSLMALFSYGAGGAVFDGEEKKRQMMQRVLEENAKRDGQK
jgi:hypothetical protein